MFACRPAPAHWVGSLNPATGLLLASKHGELRTGLTIPRLKFSVGKGGWWVGPILSDRGLLNRPEIRKRILAGVVVIGVPPHESTQRKHGVCAEHARPRRSNVKGLYLRALIRGAYDIAVRIEPPAARPRRGKLGVKRVGRLKPGTCEAQVQVNGVRSGELIVNAVKYVFFVAPGVHHDEFRRVQKPATVQAIGRDKISPLSAA